MDGGEHRETALSFYISNQPAAYPDVYFGDFTVTAAKSFKPTRFETHEQFAYPTAEELAGGYTFGFTDDSLLDTGVDCYAQLSALDDDVAEKLRALGFGERIYYCSENFMLKSVSPVLQGGQRYVITLHVYDTRGNLATSGERGAFCPAPDDRRYPEQRGGALHCGARPRRQPPADPDLYLYASGRDR